MEPVSTAVMTQAQWVQPKTFENRYELRSGEHHFATLEFPKMFGSLAVAESSEGRWTFKRVGFFNVRITVRKEGEEADTAVFQPKWTGTQGTLAFTNGLTYLWKSANFWATQYAWMGEDDEPLILYKPGVEDSALADFFKVQSRVEIHPQAAQIPYLSLLVMLGWYLMILKQQDDTAAVAATASV